MRKGKRVGKEGKREGGGEKSEERRGKWEGGRSGLGCRELRRAVKGRSTV